MQHDDVASDLDAGTFLASRYRLVRKIARGGAGQVYEARDELLGRAVAVKVLRPGVKGSSRDVDRLRREARAAVALRHENVVEVLDLVIGAGDATFLVMELLEGRTVREIVAEDGPFSPELVAVVGSQLLDALDAAHGHGLVHRDVKPDNTIVIEELGQAPRVKVLDFGAVKTSVPAPDDVVRLTASNVVLGTWQYVAPEQVRGDVLDGRADVYAAGATLFFALTALRPHQAANAERVAFAVSDDPTPPVRSVRPDVDDDLAAIIDRALAKDLGLRWASAAAMRDALRAWLAGRRAASTRTILDPFEGAAENDVVSSAGRPPPTIFDSVEESRVTQLVPSRTLVLDPAVLAAAARALPVDAPQTLVMTRKPAPRVRAALSRALLVACGALLFVLGLLGGGVVFR